tara:strand:- start:42 stop:233 length:192 start_codon:yes stop_codon:yes gene_type:complete
MDTINEKNIIAEIKLLFEKASDDSLIELLNWEQSHKNRKTLVKFIDSKLRYAQTQIPVRENFN